MARIMAVTIMGRTKICKHIFCLIWWNGLQSPTACRARSQSVPGMPMMAIAASGTSSTVVLTANPMPMARSAAMMICHTEPGSLTRCHHVRFEVVFSPVSTVVWGDRAVGSLCGELSLTFWAVFSSIGANWMAMKRCKRWVEVVDVALVP